VIVMTAKVCVTCFREKGKRKIDEKNVQAKQKAGTHGSHSPHAVFVLTARIDTASHLRVALRQLFPVDSIRLSTLRDHPDLEEEEKKIRG
jgi:hypothetical protein